MFVILRTLGNDRSWTLASIFHYDFESLISVFDSVLLFEYHRV